MSDVPQDTALPSCSHHDHRHIGADEGMRRGGDAGMTACDPEICRFTASDGYPLHYRHWRSAEDRPAGYVVALHGIQSHSAWYEYSSGRLAQSGFDVRFLDRRGSGLNKAERGHAAHVDRLVNDVAQFLAEVRWQRNREAPTSPVVLLGVSWGGKLAVGVCVKRPELMDAAALLYPGICSRFAPTGLQRLQLRLAMALGWGRKEVPLPLDDPALFTDDPDRQQFIRDDRLALHRTTVSFLKASGDLDVLTEQAPDRIRCPVLMMLAGRDRIIDNNATRRWFERLISGRRKLIEYPDAAHTLEFAPNREQFVDDLLDWLQVVRTTV